MSAPPSRPGSARSLARAGLAVAVVAEIAGLAFGAATFHAVPSLIWTGSAGLLLLAATIATVISRGRARPGASDRHAVLVVAVSAAVAVASFSMLLQAGSSAFDYAEDDDAGGVVPRFLRVLMLASASAVGLAILGLIVGLVLLASVRASNSRGVTTSAPGSS